MSAGVSDQRAEPATEQLPITQHDDVAEPTGRRRRKAQWVIALVVVLIAAGVAVVLAKPFTTAAGSPGVTDNADATGIYTVARGDLSSQTQVSATIGYQGSYSIPVPSGASTEQVVQAQQTVTEDQQTLSADEQTESDMSSAGAEGVAADQSDVATDQATLSSDQATENQDCGWQIGRAHV